MSRLTIGLATLLVASVSVAREARADDPTIDACIASFDKGQVLRDSKKLVEARAEFLACSRATCPRLIQRDCTLWLEGIDRDMGSLVIRVVGADGRDISVPRIWVDGDPVTSGAEGWAMPVNPGRHVVRVEAAGHRPSVDAIVIGQGEKNRHVTVRLERIGAEHAAAAGNGGLPAGVFIFGTVALLGLGTFGYTSIDGTNDVARLRDECAIQRACTKDEIDNVKTTMLVGDIAGTVGAVALGVTVYLLIDHFGARARPTASPRSATIVF